ncbi:hypothetical protein CLV37_10275 [Kineococcus rhizosphaerae]|uniref:Uncharacterized protein n=2 Tax=Kineococcus rhizosphaerae TaxID=559628 RepID=A0A2T0R7H7_9ACTN|nr:hypothetical protein CLV37_10275 [Kineococcus rhizosphaerae]
MRNDCQATLHIKADIAGGNDGYCSVKKPGETYFYAFRGYAGLNYAYARGPITC